MNPFIAPLLANIPGGLPITQDTVPALQINGSGTISLTGETLFLSIGNKSYSYDLYSISVTQLAAEISSVTTTEVLATGIVELLSLPDGQSNATLPATLYIQTDPAYYILGMMARMLEGRKRTRLSEVAQVNLQGATTIDLDWWGASTGIPRYQGEPDVLYAQRINGMRFRRTQNNYSIQRLLKTLGYTATVTDSTPGTFTIDIQLPMTPPNGWVYSLGQLADIISQVKSATYQATVTVQSSLQDSVVISDSLSQALNPKVWTVGGVTVGQFTV